MGLDSGCVHDSFQSRLQNVCNKNEPITAGSAVRRASGFGANLTAPFSYTFSKSRDDGGAIRGALDFTAQDSRRRACDSLRISILPGDTACRSAWLPQATFGTITSTRNKMRRIQFALKYNFRPPEYGKESMQLVIDKLIGDFERGVLSRRQLAFSLAALVTSAQGAPGPSGMRAVSLNHVTVRVPDVHRTSQFYQEFFGMPLKQHSETTHILGVGKSFFGIEQKDGGPALDHYDFGIAGFNADEAAAKLKARNLKLEPGGTKESFKFRDPDGFLVQLNGPDYTGHVGS